ncbi:hypothetical protein [Nocardia amikacinitolerans]|uniref:hypothetical protein n=1 Tax=Nocardia amikacinitolerans TaxID=756689 RepID=UPI0011805DD8|nr:hypothetical protein [Nocardia amikacinitolerans]
MFVGGGQSFTPSGMTKSGTEPWANGSIWTTITSWTPNTGTYPGSSVTSDGLNVQGTKTGATIAASVSFTGALGGTHTIRLIDQANNVIATGTGIGGTSGTCTVTANSVDLTSITNVRVQMHSTAGSSSGTVSAGGTCTIT